MYRALTQIELISPKYRGLEKGKQYFMTRRCGQGLMIVLFSVEDVSGDKAIIKINSFHRRGEDCSGQQPDENFFKLATATQDVQVVLYKNQLYTRHNHEDTLIFKNIIYENPIEF